MKMLNLLSDRLREEFGCKVYKLSLSCSDTCPNRDGTVGTKGCIFCSGKGSGEFASRLSEDVDAQIESAKALVGSKCKSEKYIAYFQSFTSTYAPINRLEKMFRTAAERDDIAAISVATRPDSISDECLNLLSKINIVKPVWVELGLQTVHESTAEYIRRGYPLSVFDDAVCRLKNAGLKVIVHMIIGLPGETDEMIFETAEYIGRSGADGIKFHLLHIIRGTDIEKEYIAGKFQCLSLPRYTDILCGCIKRIPKSVVIHRLTGDGDKRTLTAPLWSADKKKVLNYINKRFRETNLDQGELL